MHTFHASTPPTVLWPTLIEQSNNQKLSNGKTNSVKNKHSSEGSFFLFSFSHSAFRLPLTNIARNCIIARLFPYIDSARLYFLVGRIDMQGVVPSLFGVVAPGRAVITEFM